MHPPAHRLSRTGGGGRAVFAEVVLAGEDGSNLVEQVVEQAGHVLGRGAVIVTGFLVVWAMNDQVGHALARDDVGTDRGLLFEVLKE